MDSGPLLPGPLPVSNVETIPFGVAGIGVLGFPVGQRFCLDIRDGCGAGAFPEVGDHLLYGLAVAFEYGADGSAGFVLHISRQGQVPGAGLGPGAIGDALDLASDTGGNLLSWGHRHLLWCEVQGDLGVPDMT